MLGAPEEIRTPDPQIRSLVFTSKCPGLSPTISPRTCEFIQRILAFSCIVADEGRHTKTAIMSYPGVTL